MISHDLKNQTRCKSSLVHVT